MVVFIKKYRLYLKNVVIEPEREKEQKLLAVKNVYSLGGRGLVFGGFTRLDQTGKIGMGRSH